jgi:hypothetical protein
MLTWLAGRYDNPMPELIFRYCGGTGGINNTAVRMALFIEYSPAVQEVPGSIRFDSAETHHSQMLYGKDVDGSGQASTIFSFWALANTKSYVAVKKAAPGDTQKSRINTLTFVNKSYI